MGVARGEGADEDGGFPHSGLGGKQGFHLLQFYPMATHLHLSVLTAGKDQFPIWVGVHQIARAVKSSGYAGNQRQFVEGGGGEVGAAPVALHTGGATDQ